MECDLDYQMLRQESIFQSLKSVFKQRRRQSIPGQSHETDTYELVMYNMEVYEALGTEINLNYTDAHLPKPRISETHRFDLTNP